MMQAVWVGRVLSLRMRARWLLVNQHHPLFPIRLQHAMNYLMHLVEDVMQAQMTGQMPLSDLMVNQVDVAQATLLYLAIKHNREPNLN